ncbi:DUF2812 domain-containing protein [Mycoplasmatota bacterium]|nr:DUF2812 domain-containing protein [Mycoplasmatota bacterium]
MNNKKRKFWGFYSLDYKAMEKYIEDMARKGWMLEKVNRFIATFKKTKPQNIKCSIDVFPKSKSLNFERLDEYRQFCEESGWNYITEYDSFQFYYASHSDNPIPIQTDKEIEKTIVESTILKREIISSISFFIMVCLYSFMGVLDFRYTMLYSNTSTILLLVMPVMIIIMLLQSIYLIITKWRIKKGISSLKSSSSNAVIRRFCFSLVPVIILLLTVIVIVIDVILGTKFIAAIFAPIFLIGGTLFILSKNKISSTRMKVIIGIITLIFGTVASFFSTLSYINSAIGKANEYGSDYPVMELGDFLERKTIVAVNSFSDNFSIIVPQNYVHWEIQNDGVSIRTKYLMAANIHFASIIFDGMLNDELRNGETQVNANSYWNIDKAIFIEDKSRVLLQNENVVVYIEGDFDFSNDGVINIIKNKLSLESNT